MRRLPIISGILIIMISKVPSSGVDGFTLDQAITAALKNNPRVLSALKEAEASLGRRLQLEAIPDPEVLFSDEGLGLGRRSKVEGEKEISFGIQQSIEFPGKRALRSQVGKYGEQIALLEIERAKLVVKAEVKRAYYKTVLSAETVSSLEGTLVLLDRFIDTAAARYRAGSVPYLDVLRARVEKARAQNELLEARNGFRTDKVRLNILMGRRGDDPLELMTGLAFVPPAGDLAAVREWALSTRPSLKIAGLKLEQAIAGQTLSRKNLLPDFSVGLFFPSLRANAWGFNVGVTVPLYWWKKQKGETIEAEARKDIEALSRDSAEKRLLARIEEAYSDVTTAGEQVKIFEQKLLGEVESELQLSLTSYGLGKTEALDLLDITRTYRTTKLEYLKALYLYLVSAARLETAGEDNE
jgi:cobalt-zinc-cadmium efflux system outer membrane protein